MDSVGRKPILLTGSVLMTVSLAAPWGTIALFAALSFIYVAWRVPETKGADIEQTESLFIHKSDSAQR
ncbi:hypothetical protein [Microbacterium caowuchunii]|uniref:hypothetical protein n=1 Tax=Microbacterium caowuchunii TaxID=2614638 RepID=UPI001CD34414|nr:hypothetical protein [Microbacterium caowuchunii]